MAKFVFTKKAIADLADIWNYTLATWSENQADRYYELIIDTCADLAKSPQTGKSYSDIYPELYGQRISKHIIFYRKIDKSKIEITRILHAQMDLKDRWKD